MPNYWQKRHWISVDCCWPSLEKDYWSFLMRHFHSDCLILRENLPRRVLSIKYFFQLFFCLKFHQIATFCFFLFLLPFSPSLAFTFTHLPWTVRKKCWAWDSEWPKQMKKGVAGEQYQWMVTWRLAYAEKDFASFCLTLDFGLFPFWNQLLCLFWCLQCVFLVPPYWTCPYFQSFWTHWTCPQVVPHHSCASLVSTLAKCYPWSGLLPPNSASNLSSQPAKQYIQAHLRSAMIKTRPQTPLQSYSYTSQPPPQSFNLPLPDTGTPCKDNAQGTYNPARRMYKARGRPYHFPHKAP